MKIFTVLMLALTTMPCFATNPSAKDQLNALGSDLLAKADEKASAPVVAEEESEARKEAKAQSAAEEKYESDINELIDAYNTAMKKFVSECTSNGKTFKNMGCEE